MLNFSVIISLTTRVMSPFILLCRLDTRLCPFLDRRSCWRIFMGSGISMLMSHRYVMSSFILLCKLCILKSHMNSATNSNICKNLYCYTFNLELFIYCKLLCLPLLTNLHLYYATLLTNFLAKICLRKRKKLHLKERRVSDKGNMLLRNINGLNLLKKLLSQ